MNHYHRAFAVGVILNAAFVVVEASYGVMVNSLALIADAGHNLSDIIALLLAWGAHFLSSAKSTKYRTYGFRRATILASLVSAILLLLALGGIAWESFGRFSNPQPTEGVTVMVVAGIGVAVNTVTALLFLSGQQHDLNIRGAYLHMAADAVVSLGVVLAGVVIFYTNLLWVDPVISLMIVVMVLAATWHLLRDSFNLSLDAVPSDIDVTEVKTYLMALPQVVQIHDLHVWALSTHETACTVHLMVKKKEIDSVFLNQIQHDLHHHFKIHHTTIQVEYAHSEHHCMLNRDHCVE